MTKRFKEGEIVKIVDNTDEDLAQIYGKEFMIRFECEADDGSFYYLIKVGVDSWSVRPGQIESTGKFVELEPMSDTRIKVSVSQDGIGKITQVIVDDNEQE